jgi:SAM-dependent methyltransferase
MGSDRSRDVLDPVLHDIAEARHYNAWIFERARPHLGSRVLDAGAGIGTFTALAADTGAHVTAADPEFADTLRRRFNGDPRVDVVDAAVESLDGTGEFDSILCFNVLEHVEADELALRKFHALLRPGGRLLLLVPAHGFLFGAYDRAAGHVRRYDATPLRRLLERTGFLVDELRHVNPAGGVGWLVRVRLRPGDQWPSSSFRTFDRLVPLLRPLDRLRLPFGLSLWAVCRRPSGG